MSEGRMRHATTYVLRRPHTLRHHERGAVVRTVVLLLLLANLAFFAWTRQFPPDSSNSPEAHLLQQQLRPQDIKLLPPQAAPQPATETPVAATESGKGASTAAVTATAVPPAAPAAPVKQVCYEWGAFGVDDARTAEARAAKLMAGARPTQRRVMDESGTWWAYIPPFASRALAQQKVAELRKLGVDDLFIVQEDAKYRNAVSLGVFRTQEAARNRLEQLRSQGVRTAQVGPRDTSSVHVFLQVRLPETAVAELQALRQDFQGTELRTCPAR